MFTYRVAITVPSDLADDWARWMLDTHLDDLVATGCFHSYTFRQVLLQDDAPAEGVTFVGEYYCDRRSDYDRYQKEHAARLRGDVPDTFKGRLSVSRQLLTSVYVLEDDAA